MSAKSFDSLNLNQRAEEALEQRIRTLPNYTKSEIETVQSSDRYLFPRDFELTSDAAERFRHLAKFSQFELKPPVIRSHRPVIGPAIVFAKKIAWRILSALLKDCLHGQQLFNLSLVRDLASHEVRMTKVEKVG